MSAQKRGLLTLVEIAFFLNLRPRLRIVFSVGDSYITDLYYILLISQGAAVCSNVLN